MSQVLGIVLFLLVITWGIVTTIIFFGVPAHISTLVSPAVAQTLLQECPDKSAICLGMRSIVPSITFLFERMGSIQWYFIISLLAYGAFVTFYTFIHGHGRLRFSMRPWHIYALFVACMWLLFTVVTNGSTIAQQDIKLRYLIEPDKSIYVGLGEEGLRAMRDHLNFLQDKNCVNVTAKTGNNINVYSMKGVCIQGYFFIRIISQLLFITFLALLFLSIGRALLHLANFKPQSFLLELVIAITIGASAWIVVLWALGFVHLFTTIAVWVAVIIAFGITYKHAVYWLQQMKDYEWEVDTPWHSTIIITSFLLLTLLAFNFIAVIRPFPIGWDDLGVYLNEPRLFTSYGYLTPFMATFKWEFITSMGFVLFGYEQTFAATASMVINWFAGLLAVASLLLFGTRFVAMKVAVLAALLYYYMPIIGHFSFADMKTDNAVFTFQCLALFAGCSALFTTENVTKKQQYTWLALAGIFTAIGFATKPTAAMMLFAVLALILGTQWGVFACIGTCSLAFLAFSIQGIFSINAVLDRLGSSVSVTLVQIVLAVITIASITYGASKKSVQFRPTLQLVGVFIATFILATLPWLLHNNIAGGVFPPSVVMRLPSTFTTVNYDDLPAELALDRSHEQCQGSAKKEELDRYWGYQTGITHYALLGWRSVMNVDIIGYYVTSYPYVLLFPLMVLLPFIWEAKRRKFYLYLFGTTIFLLLQWTLLANGVVWYGIGMFAGICLAMALLTYRSPKYVQVPLVLLLTLSIMSAFSMRLWQYSLQQSMVEYAMGKADARSMQERTIPHYDNIRERIAQLRTQNPDRPYVYRIGTFIPYFIPQNFEVFGRQDHQLDFFNCLSQERDDDLTLRRLQALGFNSIVFDTNTASIEKDPNGSLHKKVENFMGFINNRSLGFQVPISDKGAGVSYIILP